MGEFTYKFPYPEPITRCPDCPFCSDNKNRCKMLNKTIAYHEYVERFKPDWCRLEQNIAPATCEHDVVYDLSKVLMSNPPQIEWICRKCGERGTDFVDYSTLVKKLDWKTGLRI